MGTVRLSVAGDVSGLVVRLGPGAKLTGRVVFEGTSSPLPNTENMNTAGPVTLTPHDGSMCRVGRVELAKDWTFTASGLFGTCAARFIGFPRWFGKAITIDDKDVTGQPLTFSPGQQISGVEVLFTDKQTDSPESITSTRTPNPEPALFWYRWASRVTFVYNLRFAA